MVNISFTGDLLCSARMNRAANGDYHSFFKNADKLKNCDYLVGNLETTVAGVELEYTHERYSFNTPAGFLAAIKDCGFDMLSLANNHCMDRGEQGIINTLENCERFGFDTAGTYKTAESRDAVLIKELDGIRVAFVNYTYGTNAFAHHTFLEHGYMVNLLQPEETKRGSIHLLNSYAQIAEEVKRIYTGKEDGYAEAKPYLDRLERDIKYAKAHSDYVIMLLHCGGQYVETVDPYTAYIAERIKEYGADIIVGNHQHIIQSCEQHGGYLKIFCLGNMLYDSRIECRGGYFDSPLYNAVFHLQLDRDKNGGITAKKSFGIYTTVTDADGMPVITDSADVYGVNGETYVKSQILHYANLFAGEEKYENVEERYEL